jgi:hypothetical protein
MVSCKRHELVGKFVVRERERAWLQNMRSISASIKMIYKYFSVQKLLNLTCKVTHVCKWHSETHYYDI